MGNITLVSGGTKSGKSEFAEYLAKSLKSITYVALSEIRTEDIHWQKKIKAHKSRRPKDWKLIESNDLLFILKNQENALLIDSIGGFVSKELNQNDQEWKESLEKLILSLKNYNNNLIIVGEQVGWGLVSEYEIGNKFAERLGNVLQEITKISKNNWLTINGRAISLDNISIDVPR